MSSPSLYPIPSCAECGLEAAGRCPTCRHHLCLDHFGLQDHAPCAQRQVKRASRNVCYVCGTPVKPQQWSSAVFAHYIDSSTCAGCHRPICDEQHTALRFEDVRLVRDGLRSMRYHYVRRYCSVCKPMRRIGGLLGASRLLVGIFVIASIAVFALHH